MPSPTYRARCLVLRKTKLKESDLILTLLAQDGSQIRAVAKGARKPSNPFSTRLDLHCESDVLLAKGASLDIVKEARLVSGHHAIRSDFEKSACAAAMAETLERLSQQDLPHDRLYAMTAAALDAIDVLDAAHAPALCAAHLLKAVSMCGFRPSLTQCALCGSDIALSDLHPGAPVRISLPEGGVVCAQCRSSCATTETHAGSLQWIHVLLMSTFDEISAIDIPLSVSYAVLDFARRWIREHVGATIASLSFLFTCGITCFDEAREK